MYTPGRKETWSLWIKRYSPYDTIQGEDIVVRRSAELTGDDQRELESLNLPPDQWEDDASIMAARYKLDPDYNITKVIESKPGEPLSAKYVRKQIEILMNNTQREGGKLRVKLMKR